MKKLLTVLSLMVAVVTLPAYAQTDYSEEEPNDDYPGTFLSGNPIFVSGDRLIGSIALHPSPPAPSPTDYDLHYLTFGGTGVPGIYRYTFDLDTGGADSFLVLYDTSPLPVPYYLGINDDRDPGADFSSRIVFDHFDTSGADTVWGVDISAFDPLGEYDYALTVTRSMTPVTALGLLPNGLTSLADVTLPGAGSWYSFTLGAPSWVTVDTVGSNLIGFPMDTELALFNSAGETLGGSDDIDFLNGDYDSSIRRLLSPGTYYAAVGSFDPFGVNYGSFFNWNLVQDRPLGWDRNGFSGDSFAGIFVLNVSVAAAVPEPGAWSMLLGGLPAACWALRRRSVQPRTRA